MDEGERKKGESSKIQKNVMDEVERKKESQARCRRTTERKRGEVKDRRKVEWGMGK